MANPTTTVNRTTLAPTTNPLLDPKVYWRVNAFAVSAVTLLGIVMAVIYGGGQASAKDQLLAFDSHHGLGLTWTHTAVHAVLAIAAFVFGFSSISPRVVKTFAMIFGVVYLGLGILGFIVSNPLGGGLALNLGASLNAVHILLGGWALTAGLAARY